MKKPRARHYWIVKHGHDSLQTLPNVIWRTGKRKEPPSFKSVKQGDRWIAFAYTTTDAREKPLSLVTGFYECVRKSEYRPIPKKARMLTSGSKKAWFITGTKTGWQPGFPVGVPPINDMLERKTFNQSTLINVSHEEFNRIRKEVKRRRLDPLKIPLLHREPRNEQEVVAIVAAGHEQFGIEKFLRIRSAFPDMTVKLKGRAQPVHLELELYSSSFLSHGHANRMKAPDYYDETVGDLVDRKPIAVLCWINDAATTKMIKAGKISRVFELQSLIRDEKRIKWSAGSGAK